MHSTHPDEFPTNCESDHFTDTDTINQHQPLYLRLHSVLVYTMHWIDHPITFVSVCVCVFVCVYEQISCRTIMSAVLYRFSPSFCTRLSNVVGSTPIVSEINRKYTSDFRDVQIAILQFPDYGSHVFHKNLSRVKTISVNFVVCIIPYINKAIDASKLRPRAHSKIHYTWFTSTAKLRYYYD